MNKLQEIRLLNGSDCTFIMPTGLNYSRAMKRSQNDNELDITIYLMQEICRIDGLQKTIDFYKELYCDDYIKIMTALSDILTVIK